MMLNKKNGFIALISVLIITAVSLIISAGITLKSISYSSGSLDDLFSMQALATANACGEYALGIYSSASSTWLTYGGEAPDLGTTSCSISVMSSPPDKILQITSVVSSSTRRVKITVATNTPQSVLSSWQEVGEF